jgi:hypothetical protein
MSGSCYSLRFDEGSLDGEDGDSRIRLELEGLGCDLSVNGILPPWKPGDGRAFFPSSRECFTRLVVPTPWASVHGWLRLGGELVLASGQCYSDRSLHSYPLRDFTNRTFYFRTFSPASDLPDPQRSRVPAHAAAPAGSREGVGVHRPELHDGATRLQRGGPGNPSVTPPPAADGALRGLRTGRGLRTHALVPRLRYRAKATGLPPGGGRCLLQTPAAVPVAGVLPGHAARAGGPEGGSASPRPGQFRDFHRVASRLDGGSALPRRERVEGRLKR